MFDDLITSASERYQVPAAWIRAVIQVESDWNPEAHNAADPTGAWGLMQLLYRTAQALGYQGPPEGLFDPATNIDLGTKLLAELRGRFGDDFRRVYSAYNSGNPDRWQTSSQVAGNVARAVEALESYIRAGVETLTAGSVENRHAIAGLLFLVLLWAWTGKRK